MLAMVGLVAVVLLIAGVGTLLLTRNAARNQAQQQLVSEANSLTSSKLTERVAVLATIKKTLTLEDDLAVGGERLARRACERLARLAAAAALGERHAPLADAYIASRLNGAPYAQFGAVDLANAEQTLIERILPRED